MMAILIHRLANKISPQNPHRFYRKSIELVPLPKKRVLDWFNGINPFFIISTGRSGSKWISLILKNCHSTITEHEPVPLEAWAHKEAISCKRHAFQYIIDFRLKEVYLRLGSKRDHIDAYGEANGLLRRHIEPIKYFVPNVTFIHLIRDGRDFVRSVISRGTYSGMHRIYKDFKPPIVDELSSRWDELSEFERVCWLWQWENGYIREHVKNRSRFEDLISSYEHFSSQILQPANLELDESIWESFVNRKINATSDFTFKSWEDWTHHEKKQFLEICGAEMEANSYAI
jgi:hypothetical protein